LLFVAAFDRLREPGQIRVDVLGHAKLQAIERVLDLLHRRTLLDVLAQRRVEVDDALQADG
jgi:hypothetical protein